MVTRLSAPAMSIFASAPDPSERHGRRSPGTVVISILIAGALGCTSPKADREVLVDGTVIYLGADSTLTIDRDYPTSRAIDVAGDVLIESPGQPTDLIVKTPLLVLHVTGPARIQVESRRIQDWAQVHVLSGSATVEKRYYSARSHAESLVAGDMVMLNSSVDLFEKEQFDLKDPQRRAVLK